MTLHVIPVFDPTAQIEFPILSAPILTAKDEAN
jgi:hypothetical protein